MILSLSPLPGKKVWYAFFPREAHIVFFWWCWTQSVPYTRQICHQWAAFQDLPILFFKYLVWGNKSSMYVNNRGPRRFFQLLIFSDITRSFRWSALNFSLRETVHINESRIHTAIYLWKNGLAKFLGVETACHVILRIWVQPQHSYNKVVTVHPYNPCTRHAKTITPGAFCPAKSVQSIIHDHLLTFHICLLFYKTVFLV